MEYIFGTDIQGIIDPFVGFADYPHSVMGSTLNGGERFVIGFAFNDKVLDVGVRLCSNAGDGLADGRLRIPNSRDDRDFQKRGFQ